MVTDSPDTPAGLALLSPWELGTALLLLVLLSPDLHTLRSLNSFIKSLESLIFTTKNQYKKGNDEQLRARQDCGEIRPGL